LINTANQSIVNNTDGKNFAETNTLGEFLDRYGVLEKTTKTVYDEVVVKNPQFDIDMEDYNARRDEWKRTVWDPWNEKQGTIKDQWTERVHSSSLYYDVLRTGCMDHSLNKENCYMHVISNLIGPGDHKTSDGVTYNVTTDGTWNWNYAHSPVSDSIREDLKNLYREPHDHGMRENVQIKYNNKIYNVDTMCSGLCSEDKSVYQELVDFLWMVHEDYDGTSTGGAADPNHLAMFFHFLEFDLDDATEVEHITYWDEPEPKFEAPPATPEFITELQPREVEEYEVNDKEKAQWYTNLWYRMNGQEEPARIQTKEGYEDNMDYYREYVLKSLETQKDTFANAYQVIDGNLLTSTTWLEDVLAQGIVVMQRVNSHNLDTQNKFSWDEIIYTDAAELTLETDDNAIAKAEVRYEEKMHEIEIKDKRYQMEINKLDSEHNSLQTQIDSIKSEVSKNIERSYKTFG
jgi:hypothetical protein